MIKLKMEFSEFCKLHCRHCDMRTSGRFCRREKTFTDALESTCPLIDREDKDAKA